LSFFAFTATPKGKTLELFGRKGASGLPEAFHLYSMRQAIEEGFILDVVKNYTTYATYYRLVKAIEDVPNLPKKDSGKRKPVRPRLCQRGRRHLPGVQTLLRRDEFAGKFRPAAVGEAEA